MGASARVYCDLCMYGNMYPHILLVYSAVQTFVVKLYDFGSGFHVIIKIMQIFAKQRHHYFSTFLNF